MPCRDELAAAARLLLRAIRVVVVDVTKNQDTVGEFGIVRHLHEVLQTWFLIVYRQLDHRIQTATAVSAEVSQHSSGCRGKVVLASVVPAKPAARFFFQFRSQSLRRCRACSRNRLSTCDSCLMNYELTNTDLISQPFWFGGDSRKHNCNFPIISFGRDTQQYLYVALLGFWPRSSIVQRTRMLIQVKELPEADKEASRSLIPLGLGLHTALLMMVVRPWGIWWTISISKSLITAIRIIRVAITHSVVVDYRAIVYIDMGREKEGLLAQTGWAAGRFAAIDNGFDHSWSDTTKKSSEMRHPPRRLNTWHTITP